MIRLLRVLLALFAFPLFGELAIVQYPGTPASGLGGATYTMPSTPSVGSVIVVLAGVNEAYPAFPSTLACQDNQSPSNTYTLQVSESTGSSGQQGSGIYTATAAHASGSFQVTCNGVNGIKNVFVTVAELSGVGIPTPENTCSNEATGTAVTCSVTVGARSRVIFSALNVYNNNVTFANGSATNVLTATSGSDSFATGIQFSGAAGSYTVGLVTSSSVALDLCAIAFVDAGATINGVSGQNINGAARITTSQQYAAGTTQDFSHAAHVMPMPSGTSVPSICIGTEHFYKSDTGQLYGCKNGTFSVDVGATGSTGPTGPGGANGSAGSPLVYSGSSLSLSGTQYIPPAGSVAPSGTEASVQTPSTSSANVSGFYVNLSAAPGGGNSIAFTWRKGGADQTLTCTISGSSTSCNDTAHSFTALAGDLVDIEIVSTGSVGTPNVMLSTQFSVTASITATSGTWASLPGACTIGSIYFATDSEYTTNACNVTNTWTSLIPGFGAATIPATGDWSWSNQPTSATLTNNATGGMTVLSPAQGSHNAAIITKTVPTTPYTVTVVFSCSTDNSNYGTCAVGWADAAGHMTVFAVGTDSSTSSGLGYNILHWNGPTVGGGSAVAQRYGYGVLKLAPAMVQLEDDNTNLYINVPSDDGHSWTRLYSEGRTSYTGSTGPTLFVIFADNTNSKPASTTVYSWK